MAIQDERDRIDALQERVEEQMDQASKWAFACGVLEALAGSMLGRLERCDRHDTLLNVWDRDTLVTMKAVMADPEWTQGDLGRALEAARAARHP
jgi:hypothetical protein